MFWKNMLKSAPVLEEQAALLLKQYRKENRRSDLLKGRRIK